MTQKYYAVLNSGKSDFNILMCVVRKNAPISLYRVSEVAFIGERC